MDINEIFIITYEVVVGLATACMAYVSWLAKGKISHVIGIICGAVAIGLIGAYLYFSVVA